MVRAFTRKNARTPEFVSIMVTTNAAKKRGCVLYSKVGSAYGNLFIHRLSCCREKIITHVPNSMDGMFGLQAWHVSASNLFLHTWNSLDQLTIPPMNHPSAPSWQQFGS
mmetsp:Transcript_100034/g.172624  ORF Transcript_100034/g.172624 Transcript_100034/m.172624 type:complete len:109 (-) Transcript_100034:555-881(-)